MGTAAPGPGNTRLRDNTITGVADSNRHAGHSHALSQDFRILTIGQREISRHLVRVYGRAEVTGLFVSASPYTEPAIAECKNALSQRLFVLAEVNELLMLLEDPDASLADWLRAKVIAASVERKPLSYPALQPRSA